MCVCALKGGSVGWEFGLHLPLIQTGPHTRTHLDRGSTEPAAAQVSNNLH